MIVHRINRERKASSPARLIKYMVAAKGGIDPTSWECTADYILDFANGTTEGEKVASYRVTNCGTDDPADAAILIQATQAASTRSKAEKTYHFVYSRPASSLTLRRCTPSKTNYALPSASMSTSVYQRSISTPITCMCMWPSTRFIRPGYRTSNPITISSASWGPVSVLR